MHPLLTPHETADAVRAVEAESADVVRVVVGRTANVAIHAVHVAPTVVTSAADPSSTRRSYPSVA